MKILALIPARAGSKRINKKNKRMLLGQPLISWTIKTAKKVKELSDIYVSTDDDKITKICKKLKVKVPWKRPKRLCTDGASSDDVVLHFINWYEKKISKFDGLLLLQPTSPFRKKGSIEKAIKLFKQNINKTVIGFSPLRSKELGALFFLNKRSKKVIKPSSSANLLKLNGSIYLSSPKNIRKYKSFFKPHILPLIQTSKEESIDLDTEEDWIFAKRLKR